MTPQEQVQAAYARLLAANKEQELASDAHERALSLLRDDYSKRAARETLTLPDGWKKRDSFTSLRVFLPRLRAASISYHYRSAPDYSYFVRWEVVDAGRRYTGEGVDFPEAIKAVQDKIAELEEAARVGRAPCGHPIGCVVDGVCGWCTALRAKETTP